MLDLPTIVSTYIAAYNAKDVEAMLACVAPSVSFRNLSGGEVTAATDDKESFAELARFGAAAFVERRQTVVSAMTVADTTIARIDYSAIVAADLPNGWKKGQAIALTGASLFRLRDGLIVEIVDQS
jgi:ketosteroid isomerase-like protein